MPGTSGFETDDGRAAAFGGMICGLGADDAASIGDTTCGLGVDGGAAFGGTTCGLGADDAVAFGDTTCGLCANIGGGLWETDTEDVLDDGNGLGNCGLGAVFPTT